MEPSMAASGLAPYPAASFSVSVSVSLAIGLLRTDLQNAVDCLHERGVVGLGDDPARRKETYDDVGQLIPAERPCGDGGNGVERVSEPPDELATELGQVVEEGAHDEPRLRLEEGAAGVGADEVEGVGHEGGHALLRGARRGQDLVETIREPLPVVVGGGGQHVVLAREVAVEGA